MHPWVKGIQVYSNKGPCPSSRGDNSNLKYIYKIKKISLENHFNQTWQKASLFDEDSSLFKRRGPIFFQEEIITN